jgi:membrane protein
MEELSAPTVAAGTPSSRRAAELRRRARIRHVKRWYAVLTRAFHRTALSSIDHDCLNVAQSTAYSAIVALFPALIVAAALIGLLPDTAPVRYQLAAFFDRVLPPGVSQLLDATFQTSPDHTHSVRALISAGVVSFLGASNVIATLMEGLRRARNFPADCWSFWARRRRAFQLVPLSLVPLALASVLVAFGHDVTRWIALDVSPELRTTLYAVSLLIRWAVSLSASVGVIATVYHLGVPDVSMRASAGRLAAPVGWVMEKSLPFHRLQAHSSQQPETKTAPVTRPWQRVIPGAVVATAMWFLTTLSFGWYVTRFANYSEVYGSLGAGIALLFWLYIVSLSVLCGAEFNAQFEQQLQARFKRRFRQMQAPPTPTETVTGRPSA